ncbi:hypothetical protein F2Q68_00016133 [Brassica cretica]|uniref:Uncharacterized protein n=1 Tax=Brassica cretica TaxID=69181 RepID=A0A8S9HIF0_BRACR|nr:hypothetical protein F2Q68_00016133 [Brassica cretica]
MSHQGDKSSTIHTRWESAGGSNPVKRKRIKDGPQVSLTPHFSDCVRKSRVRSRCFSTRFAKSITSIDQSPLNCVDQQSFKSIDCHLTVLVGTHIKVRRVRCLAIDGYLPTDRLSPYFDTGYIIELSFQCRRSEVNQHPVAEVIPVLLRRGQSASREEVVEKRNVCRLMQNS